MVKNGTTVGRPATNGRYQRQMLKKVSVRRFWGFQRPDAQRSAKSAIGGHLLGFSEDCPLFFPFFKN